MKLLIPAILILLAALSSCIDAVIPAIRNDADILLIEGDIMDQPGRSKITIARWVPDGQRYRALPQREMVVVSVAEDGSETPWVEQPTAGLYAPVSDFSAPIGSTHFIRVTTQDGAVVESRAETVPVPVPVGEVSVEFEAESYYRPAISRFVPTFKYYLSINDPAGAPITTG